MRGGEWQDTGDDEVFLQRALAAIQAAGQRGDGVVEMEEREWQAWKLHEAMEREIEKRVAEREMEREMQRERDLARASEREMEREMQRERDLARAEELQRELDMLRMRSGGPSPGGEPGFMVDQGFAPIGGLGYSSNSSSSSSLLLKTARPYSTFTGRQQPTRFMPDSTDPIYAQNLRPTPLSYPSVSSFRVNTPPTPSSASPPLQSLAPPPPPKPQPAPAPAPILQPTKPAATPSTTSSPSRKSSSRSSSLTRETIRTRRLSTPADAAAPAKRERASSKTRRTGSGSGSADGAEEVYTSAATALKDARRRRRGGV